MKKRVHVFVEGRVQGVFFRANVRREAAARDIVGWVRNLRDGRVEAVFDGEPHEVDSLLDYVRGGPEGARVDRLALTEESSPAEQFSRFEIRY